MVRKIYQCGYMIVYLISIIVIEFYILEKSKNSIENDVIMDIVSSYFILELLSLPNILYELVRVVIRRDHSIRNYLYLLINIIVVYLFLKGEYLWIVD